MARGVRKPAEHLSDAEEKFAKNVALGKSQAEAVRVVWPAYRTKSDQACCVRGSTLMARAKIRRRVDELRGRVETRARERFDVDADWVIQRLAAIADASIEDVVVFDREGQPSIDLSKADKLRLRGFAGVKVKRKTRTIEASDDGTGGGIEIETETDVRLPDRTAALTQLGKHVGVFKEQEVVVNVSLGDRLTAAIERRREARKGSTPVATRSATVETDAPRG